MFNGMFNGMFKLGGVFLEKRYRFLYELHHSAVDTQTQTLANIIRMGSMTKWGKDFSYQTGMTVKDFRRNTPLSRYEDLWPWIERSLNGESDVLWPGFITKFAKSSGTTNARSKFLPVTKESLKSSHFQGGKDMWVFYLMTRSHARAYLGKTVGVGGSLDKGFKTGLEVGDLSAVLMANLPFWAQWKRAPKLSVAMMSDWDQKLGVMAQELVKCDVRALAGVPTWTLLLIKEIITKNQLKSIYEVWPNLEVFFHGAVAFDPYRPAFAEISSGKLDYLELYNASEGFFAIQDDPSLPNQMMLMLDYGIFYEFKALDSDEVLTIGDVVVGVPYEMIITTNAGLWRYRLGDVVEFTNIDPYRIKITGRTKHFINAFGEELMVSNAEQAIAEAQKKTGCLVTDYTAGPQYIKDGSAGYHEWLIEFAKSPDDLEKFRVALDQALQALNSDYASKRKGDLALALPKVVLVPKGVFRQFLESRGDITGRNKVPRLANNREYIEKIKTFFVDSEPS